MRVIVLVTAVLAAAPIAAAQLELIVVNQCPDTIWPGLVTQAGTGPKTAGFALTSGSNQTIDVGTDWAGRIWGRTNCSFPDPDKPGGCTTGECGSLGCIQAGNPPATLAEFTMNGSYDRTFYDISLVDGYNLPLAIVLNHNGVSELDKYDASSTNPSCVGSVNDLAPQGFNPYANNQQFLGTTASDPASFDETQTASSVADWCPWDLQVDPPAAPGDGVYPYPDGNIKRPAFDPCLSACAKYNKPQYCCTGSYDSASQCSPNYYSKAAKAVCPDAYSYAYDDQTSTFIVPQGGQFSVIFCPGGRSTDIIASNKKPGGNSSPTSSATSASYAAWFAGKSMIDGIARKAVFAGFWLLVMGLY